jgi:transposase
MLILYDQRRRAREQQSLTRRLDQTKAAFHEQAAKLNRYRLKTAEAIDTACQSMLKTYQTSEFFTYTIVNEPVITYKQATRGRPAKGRKPKKTRIVTDHFRVELTPNQSVIEAALEHCGYYPLMTNKPDTALSLSDAMRTQKDQYKPEHTHRRSKSGYSLEPIYLHTPERIEAFLFLFKLVLQVLVLLERTARHHIVHRDKGLDQFRPNRQDVRNPTAEYLLNEFQYVVKGSMTLPDGHHYTFISELTELQHDILNILEVPIACFTVHHLFDSG